MSDRSRGTPRIANNILKRIRDYSEVLMPPVVDEAFVTRIMATKLHIDHAGLTPLDRKYLRALTTSIPIGAEAIATKLNEEVETIEDYVEPYLLRLGYIERRSNGRCLTLAGEDHIHSIPRIMDR
jgi:Holliday junction DNA helicase RuvB